MSSDLSLGAEVVGDFDVLITKLIGSEWVGTVRVLGMSFSIQNPHVLRRTEGSEKLSLAQVRAHNSEKTYFWQGTTPLFDAIAELETAGVLFLDTVRVPWRQIERANGKVYESGVCLLQQLHSKIPVDSDVLRLEVEFEGSWRVYHE